MMNENILEALQENIQDIGHIQFADCPHRHQPDTGNINYADIFDYLNQSNYKGFVAAEYKPQPSSETSFDWKDKYFSNNHINSKQVGFTSIGIRNSS